jgi:ribosome-associated translation inhibitor RaiA
MQLPLQVVFEHLEQSDPLEGRIREEAKKLEEFYGRITSVRVVVCRPQHRHEKGDTYQVRIHVTIPGAADIVISHDPAVSGRHEDAYVAIHDAFKAARRQLQDLVRERRPKIQAPAPTDDTEERSR